DGYGKSDSLFLSYITVIGRGGYLRIPWGHGALQKRRFKRMNGFYIGSFTALNNLFYRRRS
ncbi:hypothetical protein, partial [Bacteroides fragilis]|uniref:hypothetical protein n=1 Tax=Bacteroides fragilis TaxID=817 RepID=UPI0032ECC57C